MAGSGVLLHLPFGDPGHPGKVGPSVGINLPKVVRVYVVRLRAVSGGSFYIGNPIMRAEGTGHFESE